MGRPRISSAHDTRGSRIGGFQVQEIAGEDKRRAEHGEHVQQLRIERFPAKWMPVRVKKTRQNKEIEPPFRFNRNGKGSRKGVMQHLLQRCCSKSRAHAAEIAEFTRSGSRRKTIPYFFQILKKKAL